MAEIMGPLADSIIGTSNREGWQTFFEKDWLVQVNESTASAESFFTMPMGGAVTSGERVVKVTVDIEPPKGRTAEEFERSAAGILVESTTTKNSCLGEITLGGNGLVLCFGDDGKSTEMGRLPGAAKLDGSDLLEWVEQPGVGGFFLNGELIAKVEASDILGGDVGILAYERGDFYFRNFAVSTAEGPVPSGKGATSAPTSNTTPDREGIPFINSHESQLIGAYLGVTNGIFMHEFGHALIAELQLPSTGPEEDAVDIFSALRVVEPTMYPSGDETIDLIGREVAIYSVLPWYYGGMINAQTGQQMPWQDEHTGDLRRFRNTFCVIYGGNPGLYGHIADQVGMEERTLSRCAEEFNRQNRAWRTILAPHTRIGAWHPDGHLTADAPGSTVNVTFETPTTPVSKFLVEAFEDGLRGFAEDLAKTYVLPRDLTVTYRQCGELNAWYAANEGSITMCYDLIEYLVDMLAEVETVATETSSASPTQAEAVPVQAEMIATAGALNELADYGIPATSVLFPAPYRGPTPASHIRADVLTTPAVVDMLTSSDNWLLVDTSGGAETLPGAFAVVDAGKDGSLTDRFQGIVDEWLIDETGGDKSKPIIFFGSGMQDRSAYNAALRAGMAGWKAYWYRGGIEAWRSNSLPMATQID
jgi:rhodanese-related sulfurtransferase